MIEFSLWLITSEREIADKWYRLFSRERFNCISLPGFAAIGSIPQEAWGLVFVGICADGIQSPQHLKALLGGRKNLSVIVFNKPGKTSNPEISAFLECGADDFILSDIDERVLLSKAKAHIRRLLPSLNLAKTTITSADGDVQVEKVRRTVKLGPAGGKTKTLDGLTPKEFEIFFMLLGNEGRAVSRRSLMEDIWSEKSGQVNSETIDKHVETLRRKLGPYGKNIKTIYGTGYIYKGRSEEPL